MLVKIIKQQHELLSQLFANHQAALIQIRFDIAQDYLEQFTQCLQSHMQIEEQYLFPTFADIEHESRWDVTLYVQEHRKIEKILKEIQQDLNWLIEQNLSESDLHRNVIALIDKQKSLKGLNAHHEDREETAMLLDLEKQLDDIELRVLASDIKFTWAEVVAALKHSE